MEKIEKLKLALLDYDITAHSYIQRSGQGDCRSFASFASRGIRIFSRTGHWTFLKLLHLKEKSIIQLEFSRKSLTRKWRQRVLATKMVKTANFFTSVRYLKLQAAICKSGPYANPDPNPDTRKQDKDRIWWKRYNYHLSPCCREKLDCDLKILF